MREKIPEHKLFEKHRSHQNASKPSNTLDKVTLIQLSLSSPSIACMIVMVGRVGGIGGNKCVMGKRKSAFQK